jgi:hypothetical protein
MDECENVQSEELPPDDYLAMMAANTAFEFLSDPAEDIYTIKDGRVYRAKE